MPHLSSLNFPYFHILLQYCSIFSVSRTLQHWSIPFLIHDVQRMFWPGGRRSENCIDFQRNVLGGFLGGARGISKKCPMDVLHERIDLCTAQRKVYHWLLQMNEVPLHFAGTECLCSV